MSGREFVGPNRRALLIMGGASFALAACSSNIIGPPDAAPIYVLHPKIGNLAGPKVAWALSVDVPEANDNLDTRRIAISRSANTQDYFANSAWPDKLPNLVQGVLIEAFESSGRIDQVATDTQGVRTDYVLQTEIRDFEARYNQPDGPPTAVVKVAVRLVLRSDHTIAGHLVAAHETAATQNSVEAAVEAFDQALGEVVSQIVSWTLDAVPAANHRERSRRHSRSR
jgi:cholesterol transport system auxiliary component